MAARKKAGAAEKTAKRKTGRKPSVAKVLTDNGMMVKRKRKTAKR
ncbi:MAG: hypothetical protein WDO17_02945 [Alphaproteobacteria bacterium]